MQMEANALSQMGCTIPRAISTRAIEPSLRQRHRTLRKAQSRGQHFHIEHSISQPSNAILRFETSSSRQPRCRSPYFRNVTIASS